MPQTNSQLIGIRFDTLEHGWSILEIGLGAQPFVISGSHVFSDPCADLMMFCERILSKDFGATVRFWEEPNYISHQFGVRNANPLLEVSRERLSERSADKAENIMTVSVNPVYFVALCLGEFKRLAFLSNLPEHTRNRRGFPWEAYNSLLKRWDDESQNRSRKRKDE
jgi:hypothetical protein